MIKRSQLYNVFDEDGKLLQVEYAMEGVKYSNPIVAARNNEIVVCAVKKQYTQKLMDEEILSVHKISKRINLAMTGFSGDIDEIISKLKTICFNKEYNLGVELTPDMLCKIYADKTQELMHSTGERLRCFGAIFFGFDNNSPVLCATDTTAIFYHFFGVSYGEKSSAISKFLGDNFNISISNNKLVEIVVQSLLESLGHNTTQNEIDVYVLEKDKDFVRLDEKQKDKILRDISDK